MLLYLGSSNSSRVVFLAVGSVHGLSLACLVGPLIFMKWEVCGRASILGLRHDQLHWPVGHIAPTHPRRPPHTLCAHPSTRTLRTHTSNRLQGCLPNPPDTHHALTHPSLSACAPACVRRARAARASHRKPIRPKNASPAARPSLTETRGKMMQNTVCAMFSAQWWRPHSRKKDRSLDRRLARHVRLPPAIFEGFERCRGCKRCKGCWNAQMLVMQECRGCWRSFRGCGGCWRSAGDCPGRFALYLQCFFAWHQKPAARPGRPGMFWGASVWAAGDAGLGVQGCPRSSSSKTHSTAGFCLSCVHDVFVYSWFLSQPVTGLAAAFRED